MELVTTPVAKTALDALNAKISATNFGYQPVQRRCDLYVHFLSKMKQAILLEQQSSGVVRVERQRSYGYVKRQPPLVNAGYALRVASLSKMIFEFIHCHNKQEVNVVLIGCGFDVLGLWCASYDNVNVYEIDCFQNCALKRQALITSNLVFSGKERSVGDAADDMNDDEDILFEGCFNCHLDDNPQEIAKYTLDPSNKNDDRTQNYTLMSADLRCISSLQKAFSNSSFNANTPTIVVSELVLAYLGSGSVRELLSYLSSKICRNEQSLFVAYEPVSTMDGNAVIKGYTKDYFGQFSSKLNKGNAMKKEEQKSSSLSACHFEPIGRSSLHTIDIIRSCGFDGFVDCKKIISSAQKLNLSHINISPELFDEHAALRLHMHCYCIIAAQISCIDNVTINNFVQVCPWSDIADASCGMGRLFERINPSSPSDNITISSIRNQYQEQVRVLFGNTYNHLFDQYPSVKKMVKNALKTDLSTRIIEINDDGGKMVKSERCAIWEHYTRNGGAFWVVIDKTYHDRIVGCIGITKRLIKDDNSTSRSYEIHRLTVHPDYRGKGTGKFLLQTAEDFVQLKEYIGTTALYATTPEIMEAANSFYLAHSYEDIGSVQLGNMNIKTYRKIIVHSNEK